MSQSRSRVKARPEALLARQAAIAASSSPSLTPQDAHSATPRRAKRAAVLQGATLPAGALRAMQGEGCERVDYAGTSLEGQGLDWCRAHTAKWPCQAARVCLTLPWPPTTNNLYATVNGHRVKSAVGRAYADAVGVLVGQQAKPWTLTPPYRLTITLHAPARTGRYDISNREKALCDSIFHAIGQDDSLIDDLRLVRGPVDRTNPRCEVVVEELS